ncbi:DNA-binding storekeeper protein-relatedtranscriptional regulator [Striga asiatica]|uniref:DNA-binding storekeeper protein-relatedtranscriptional regulator n=1 Tax=Striga asiatica TaxID=4170 RepID=A0A5A7QV62_STRAF|nr:DNA-binding storekeeper protein-relatedtranscriptional regulator [Striga asiatica]
MASREPSSHKKTVKKGNRTQPPPATKVVAKSGGAAQDMGSVPNSDLGDNRLPPVPKTPNLSSKRARDDEPLPTDGKKEKAVEAEKSRGGCITRLWSNEDEITLLKGVIAFRGGPSADMAAFYDYIKGNLKFESSREQLRRKVSRLKQRYLNALKKGKNGEDPVFSNPHEDRLFELSKIIWGGQNSKSIVLKEKEAADSKKLKEKKNKSKDNGGRTYTNPHEQEIYDLSEKLWGAEKENGFNKASANGDHRNSEMMKSFLMGKELIGFDERTLAAAKHLLEEGEMEDENRKTWKKLKIEETEVLLRHSKISFIWTGIANVSTSEKCLRAVERSNCYHKYTPCVFGLTFYILLLGVVQIFMSQIPDFHSMDWLSVNYINEPLSFVPLLQITLADVRARLACSARPTECKILIKFYDKSKPWEVWPKRTAYVSARTAIAMVLPYCNQVLGVSGAITFWPLAIYFPVEMWLGQNKTGA